MVQLVEVTEQGAFPALAGAEFMVLTTSRRDGAPVPTPVWFAQVGDRLVVTTWQEAGKAKRLRANGRATVAPCTARGQVLGPAQAAQGRVLPTDEFPAAEAHLRAKYPTYDALTTRMLGAAPGRRIFLELWSAA